MTILTIKVPDNEQKKLEKLLKFLRKIDLSYIQKLSRQNYEKNSPSDDPLQQLMQFIPLKTQHNSTTIIRQEREKLDKRNQ